jgi:hypothetical protein
MTTTHVNNHLALNRQEQHSWLGRQFQRWMLRRAIAQTFAAFAPQNRDWVDYAFDEWFLTQRAFSLFSHALEHHTWPTPVELARLWSEQFAWVNDETRARHTTALIPVAADFLSRLKLELAS